MKPAHVRTRVRPLAACLALTLSILAACGGGGSDQGSAAPPTQAAFPPNDPNAQFGSRESVLFWTPAQQQVGYRNMELIFSTRPISHVGGSPQQTFELPSTPIDLSGFRYTYNGSSYSLDDYIARNRVAGLLLLRHGSILYERYSFGHSSESKWTSFSVAKSVVSMLVGAAVRDGYISIEDTLTQYLPQLRGTAYDGVVIRHLLQMSSGVRWNEDYDDPGSNIVRVSTAMRTSGTSGLLQYMGALQRAATPGTRFNYNTGDVYLLGAALQAALQQNLSSYLSQKIWAPFGMESDAFWMLSTENGDELGGCCISATLRDYGRIGIFAMRGGLRPDGVAVLADDWMRQSTTPSPTASDYGYLWWLDSGNFHASGVFGQTIQIYPRDDVVIVMQSFWPADAGSDYSGHRTAVSTALRAVLP